MFQHGRGISDINEEFARFLFCWLGEIPSTPHPKIINPWFNEDLIKDDLNNFGGLSIFERLV